MLTEHYPIPSPEAATLLEKVALHILEEPRRLYMNTWFLKLDPKMKDPDYPPCGTVGCIAGWTAALSGRNQGEHPAKVAREVLQLTEWQENSLFFSTGWPKPYMMQYLEARTKKAEAKATAARIRHFIKTGE